MRRSSNSYHMIQAKPTRYKRILFRSRLEARWAIFLDNHKLVESWEYEPLTVTNSKGWQYTPDFYVRSSLNPTDMFLEIKPIPPTKSYETTLLSFTTSLHCPLFLCYGDWFKVPFYLAHVSSRKSSIVAKVNDMLFADSKAFDLASHYRFDLSQSRRRRS